MPRKKIVTFSLVLVISAGCAFADRAHEIAKTASLFIRANAKNAEYLKSYAAKYASAFEIPQDLYLNFLKNQSTLPDFDPEKFLTEKDFEVLNASSPAGITAWNHADFSGLLSGLGEGNIYGLIGYVYYASPSEDRADGGSGSDYDDEHGARNFFTIWLGFDEALAKQLREGQVPPKAELAAKSVTVEMTAQFFTASRPNWSLALLNAELGRPVKVVGQLIFDNGGLAGPSANNPVHAAASAGFSLWKIRPVTRFYIGRDDMLSAPASGDWKTIEEIMKE